MIGLYPSCFLHGEPVLPVADHRNISSHLREDTLISGVGRILILEDSEYSNDTLRLSKDLLDFGFPLPR